MNVASMHFIKTCVYYNTRQGNKSFYFNKNNKLFRYSEEEKKSNKWVTKKIIHLHHSIFWIRLLSINNNINVDNV